MLAPIVLFAYNRPKHLKRVIESLLVNAEAKYSDLILYSDGAKSYNDILLVDAVREVAESISGFRSITIKKQKINRGLADSVISGVTEVLKSYEKIIVLEDDLVVSPFFLKYMNEALSIYKDDPLVAEIHGYLLPLDANVPETFFLKGADCWGWATWRRAWNLFNPNGLELLSELKMRSLEKEFDLGGFYPYTKMLVNQTDGLNQSWAIRWQASIFLKGMMTLYPGRSLVQNIGNDGSGVHCSATSQFDIALSKSPINVVKIPVVESDVVLRFVKNYHKKSRWLPRRIFRFLANQLFSSSS